RSLAAAPRRVVPDATAGEADEAHGVMLLVEVRADEPPRRGSTEGVAREPEGDVLVLEHIVDEAHHTLEIGVIHLGIPGAWPLLSGIGRRDDEVVLVL